jgi:hypothetical protein
MRHPYAPSRSRRAVRESALAAAGTAGILPDGIALAAHDLEGERGLR